MNKPGKPRPGKDAAELADEAIDRAGMPSVGRRKRGGKWMNIVALAAVAGIGGAAIIMTPSAGGKTTKKPKPNTEEVANHMQPLPMPDAPPPLPDTPPPLSLAPQAASAAPAGAAPEKHEQTWEERKLGFDEPAGAPGSAASVAGTAPNGPAALASTAAAALETTGGTAPAPGSLAARLEPSVFPMVYATMLPDRNYVLAAGTLLDCILDTRIESTVQGLVKCHIPRDVYSDNKQVLLLERGTELLGQQVGSLQQGQDRQFVVFTRLKTGNGVIANINSPATDALGGAGIPGWVDTRFGQRFGAAIGIALMQDVAAVAVASQSHGGGQNTLVLGNTAQAGGTLAEKALESTVNLPPVSPVQQGALIQVMLARDVDFRRVYDLERSAP